MDIIFTDSCKKLFSGTDDEFYRLKEKIIEAFASNQPFEIIDSIDIPEVFSVDQCFQDIVDNQKNDSKV